MPSTRYVAGSITVTESLPLLGTYTRAGSPATCADSMPGRSAAYASRGSSSGGIPGSGDVATAEPDAGRTAPGSGTAATAPAVLVGIVMPGIAEPGPPGADADTDPAGVAPPRNVQPSRTTVIVDTTLRAARSPRLTRRRLVGRPRAVGSSLMRRPAP